MATMSIDDFEKEMSGKSEEDILQNIEHKFDKTNQTAAETKAMEPNDDDDSDEDEDEDESFEEKTDETSSEEKDEYSFDKAKWEELGKKKGWIGGQDDDLALKGLPNRQELTNHRFVEELDRLIKATDYDNIKELEEDDPDKAQKIRSLAWDTAVKDSAKEFEERFNKALNSSKHVDTMKMIFDTIQSQHKDVPLDLLTIEAVASVYDKINKTLNKKREKANAHVITGSKKAKGKATLSRAELQMCQNLNIKPDDFVKYGRKR